MVHPMLKLLEKVLEAGELENSVPPRKRADGSYVEDDPTSLTKIELYGRWLEYAKWERVRVAAFVACLHGVTHQSALATVWHSRVWLVPRCRVCGNQRYSSGPASNRTVPQAMVSFLPTTSIGFIPIVSYYLRYTTWVQPVWELKDVDPEKGIALFEIRYFGKLLRPFEEKNHQEGNLSNILRPRRFLQGTFSSGAEVDEEDVLHSQSFLDTIGESLSKEDAEKFLTFFTTPYIRIPLILSFFTPEKVSVLFQKPIRHMLERVLFEPHTLTDYSSPEDPSIRSQMFSVGEKALVKSVPVMASQPWKLGSKFGLLINELQVCGDVSVYFSLPFLQLTLCYGPARAHECDYPLTESGI